MDEAFSLGFSVVNYSQFLQHVTLQYKNIYLKLSDLNAAKVDENMHNKLKLQFLIYFIFQSLKSFNFMMWEREKDCNVKTFKEKFEI